MADLRQELEHRRQTWDGFLSLAKWSAIATAVTLLLMWLFLV